MFSKIKNPGAVLKNITTWIFYVELAFSVIGGIILFFEEMIFESILSILGGDFVAWFSAFVVYCFGQLIENSDITAGRLTLEEVTKSTVKQTAAYVNYPKNIPAFTNVVPQESASGSDYLKSDGKIRITCPHCKSELSYAKDEFVADRKFSCAFCGKTINVSDFLN